MELFLSPTMRNVGRFCTISPDTVCNNSKMPRKQNKALLVQQQLRQTASPAQATLQYLITSSK